VTAVFWAAALLVAYVYAGFPCWLWLRCRWRARPVSPRALQVPISVVLVIRNEEARLPAKLATLRRQDYPAALTEVVVVSDGSTDGTNALLAAQAGPSFQSLALPAPVGKASALNHALAAARGEIVVFTDARQELAPDAVRRLVDNFADPEVGAVSGELVLRGGSQQGLGLYWQMEKKIRQWESAAGSVVGATGALYAARRDLLSPLPAGTILDDVYLPLAVARQGKRVIFEPLALAYDDLGDHRHEFRRKVRTLTGNYQLLQLAPWLLTRANPLRFEFISHKLLRLLVPFALVATWLAALALPGPFYRAAFLAQTLFYALAALAGARSRLPFVGQLAELSRSFVLLNTAAAMALFYFVTGRRAVWIR
jgi:biofilm PGA synthesis N-glycosyltransferase PgaC